MQIYQIINKKRAKQIAVDVPVRAHGIVEQDYLRDDEPEYDIEREAERYAFQRWYESELEADIW